MKTLEIKTITIVGLSLMCIYLATENQKLKRANKSVFDTMAKGELKYQPK